MPSVGGAFSLNVNVPTEPGPTIGSSCIATRSFVGQPKPRVVWALSSFATPRVTCWVGDPRTHVFAPVLRRGTGIDVTSPGRKGGWPGCPTNLLWEPRALAGKRG